MEVDKLSKWSKAALCILNTASYLPRPSSLEFQFVYVDEKGKVCARSRPFTFGAPKPLEELETLKEEQDEEDEGEELLLVIPRAQLLQVGRDTHAAHFITSTLMIQNIRILFVTRVSWRIA